MTGGENIKARREKRKGRGRKKKMQRARKEKREKKKSMYTNINLIKYFIYNLKCVGLHTHDYRLQKLEN